MNIHLMLIVYFLLFLMILHSLLEYFPIIRTEVFYHADRVFYTIFFLDKILYETENVIFAKNDFILTLKILNNFINMNIRIL